MIIPPNVSYDSPFASHDWQNVQNVSLFYVRQCAAVDDTCNPAE